MPLDIFRKTHQKMWDKMAAIPGPDPSFPLGNVAEFFGKDPWEVAASYATQFGSISKFWVGGTPAIVLNDHSAIEHVLGDQQGDYYKKAPFDALAQIITTENMFIANGETWEIARTESPFSHALFQQWLDAIFPDLQRFIRSKISEASGPIDDLIDWLRRFAYDAFSVAIWGEPLGEDSYYQFMELAKIGSRRMVEIPLLQKLPPLFPGFYTMRSHWYDNFERRVEGAFHQKDLYPNTLLSLTVKAGTKLRVDQLANQFSAPVYFGGVFSMSSAIAYALFYLQRSPKVQRKIIEDLNAIEATESSSHRDPWMKCESLDHALREAMRLEPPVPLYFRNSNREKEVVLAGHTLPPNTMLLITNWYLHRCESHWDAPLEYRPDRWANGNAARNPIGSDYFFPFGRGPRTCIGQAFAMFFMKTALAELLRSRKLQIVPEQSLNNDFFFAVRHPKGLQATFSAPNS